MRGETAQKERPLVVQVVFLRLACERFALRGHRRRHEPLYARCTMHSSNDQKNKKSCKRDSGTDAKERRHICKCKCGQRVALQRRDRMTGASCSSTRDVALPLCKGGRVISLGNGTVLCGFVRLRVGLCVCVCVCACVCVCVCFNFYKRRWKKQKTNKR